jgi:catechol 2,3-dioxygenase-like lactoylglutathione lyase family enzyme
MSTDEARGEDATSGGSVAKADMKLEVIVIPVSDVERAKEFYARLRWRLDADFAAGEDFRVIQFTPPGSGCSVIFGKNVTAAALGSAGTLVFQRLCEYGSGFAAQEARHPQAHRDRPDRAHVCGGHGSICR